MAIYKIGGRVRYHRKKQELTQKQLGDLCGLSVSAISSLENGKGDFRMSDYKHIADALNIDMLDLMQVESSQSIRELISYDILYEIMEMLQSYDQPQYTSFINSLVKTYGKIKCDDMKTYIRCLAEVINSFHTALFTSRDAWIRINQGDISIKQYDSRKKQSIDSVVTTVERCVDRLYGEE